MRRTDVPLPEVASGVYRYGSRYINCYLIEEGGRFTLLDTGLPRYVRNLHGALGKLGRSVVDIDAIVLTHCHVDHMGAARRVERESSGRVFVHEADAPVVRGDRKQKRPDVATKMFRRFFLRYMMHLLSNDAARYPTVAKVNTFLDGETIEVPGSPRVIHSPGHTEGNSALFLTDRKVLFSGDALVTLDTLTGATGPQVFKPPFTEDYEEAIRSIDRLVGIDADVTLPGHGEPWTGTVADAVAIAHRKAEL